MPEDAFRMGGRVADRVPDAVAAQADEDRGGRRRGIHDGGQVAHHPLGAVGLR
jgi:hypothetical protein